MVRDALRDVWSDLWTALVCDFLWYLGFVLVLPGPPVTMALFYYANLQAKDEPTDLKDFWRGLRQYWGSAWRWGVINLVILLIFIGDVYLTGRGDATPLAHFIQGFYLTCAAAWLIVQGYALPFLLEQEKPSVRQALRNGAVMLGQNPIFSFILWFSLLLICLIGLPLFLLSVGFGPMLVAAAANRAVLAQLKKI